MILSVIESFVLNFVLLLVCVINIRNGAVGGVHYYEQPVKDRVVELGLITENEDEAFYQGLKRMMNDPIIRKAYEEKAQKRGVEISGARLLQQIEDLLSDYPTPVEQTELDDE